MTPLDSSKRNIRIVREITSTEILELLEVQAPALMPLIPCWVQTFSSDEIRNWAKPCVYVFISLTRGPLYVGTSQHGITRPFSPNHQIPGVKEVADKLIFLAFDTFGEASMAEELLIAALVPMFNRKGVPWQSFLDLQGAIFVKEMCP